jgi:hypothetical protein
MSNKQRVMAGMTSLVMAFLSLFGYPTTAHAAGLAERLRCSPELPNELWTQSMAKSYAKFVMSKYGWNAKSEFKALNKLWNQESHWNPLAYNTTPASDGSHAGGIPQVLGMSTRVPAPLQIDIGLEYIKQRYGKPSVAWAHERRHFWY